jgi:hypothetical protein
MSRLYERFDPVLAQQYLERAVQSYRIGVANPTGSNPGLYGQRGQAGVDEMFSWGRTKLQSACRFLPSQLVRGAERPKPSPSIGDSTENYAGHVSQTEFTRGIVFFDDWGSLRYAAGASFSAALYYDVTGDTTARDLALSQLNYILGDNPYGRSFVVGFGNTRLSSRTTATPRAMRWLSCRSSTRSAAPSSAAPTKRAAA